MAVFGEDLAREALRPDGIIEIDRHYGEGLRRAAERTIAQARQAASLNTTIDLVCRDGVWMTPEDAAR